MFSYSNVAESSIVLRSSRRTGDHHVIFSIDGLDPRRTGRKRWSCYRLKIGSGKTRRRQYQTPSFGCATKAGKPSDGFARADVISGMISKRQLSKGTFGPEMNLMPQRIL